MSVKRPPRRYLGLRFTPPAASRREVGAAIEALWKARSEKGTVPRLLVCQTGVAVVVVPRGEERQARAAFGAAAPNARFRFTPVVTSGTIATVKERLAVKDEKR